MQKKWVVATAAATLSLGVIGAGAAYAATISHLSDQEGTEIAGGIEATRAGSGSATGQEPHPEREAFAIALGRVLQENAAVSAPAPQSIDDPADRSGDSGSSTSQQPTQTQQPARTQQPAPAPAPSPQSLSSAPSVASSTSPPSND